jgi:CRP-like cAMP-binding protein
LEEYQKWVEGAFHHYELNPEKVWRELQDELLTDQGPVSLFLENVPTEELKRLSNMAAVMDVPVGGTVTRAALVEEEIFLILEGVFEVLVDGRQVDLLHVGDIFGELAFFLSTHRRTATIQAVTDGQVLVIGRRFLAKIRKENPTLAADLLFNLCRIMADRQARTDSVCYGQHGQETG